MSAVNDATRDARRILARRILHTIAAELRRPPFNPEVRIEDRMQVLSLLVERILEEADIP